MTDLKNIGLEPVDLDLRNYFGKSNELKQALSNFDLVWVKGGNAFVLRRAFHLSGADEIIKELLANDAIVYGGYSAGVDMLTPSLHGTELVDNPNVIPEGYDPEIIWECLNILPYAVAPHYKSDHPESADVDKSVKYLIDNHMPFMALRDGEVIVRNGSVEKVIN
jgi:dipeptidase E